MIKNYKKIIFWSPMLSHVGTINAVIGMATALKKSKKYKIYIFNIFGEFDEFKDNENFKFINFFSIKNSFLKTGLISKIIIYLSTFILIPIFILKITKIKPHIIIANLVGYLPVIFKFFFKDLIVINSIQGYPKFNFVRKFIWRIFYIHSDLIFTMTNITKDTISQIVKINKKIIYKIENPVISKKIKLLSKDKLDNKDQFLFQQNKKIFCAIGRLTRQKNFRELIEFLHKFQENNNEIKFNLVILGEGEEYQHLKTYINNNNISNFYLLGYKKNPYNFLKKSDLFISTSLWEEPGHTFFEAGYLNVPVLASNCPNGPMEILLDGKNCLKYNSGDYFSFQKQLLKFLSLPSENNKRNLINLKKITKFYTAFNFEKKFTSIINLKFSDYINHFINK